MKGEGLVNPGPRSEFKTVEFPKDFNTYNLMGNVGNLIAVDPGLSGTGWAVFDRHHGKDPQNPIDSGSISCPCPEAHWWKRAENIAHLLIGTCRRYSCFALYIELPKFYESAGAGLSAARDGDLVKLSILVGMIIGAAAAPGGGTMHCVPVPIADWKGQMDKDLCAQRIKKRLPKFVPKTKLSHEMDAVGIGLFVKGWF
jgi:hypothetical protein